MPKTESSHELVKPLLVPVAAVALPLAAAACEAAGKSTNASQRNVLVKSAPVSAITCHAYTVSAADASHNKENYIFA